MNSLHLGIDILSAISTPSSFRSLRQLSITSAYLDLAKSMKIMSNFSSNVLMISAPSPIIILELILNSLKFFFASLAIFSSISIVVRSAPALARIIPLYPFAVPSSRTFFGLNSCSHVNPLFLLKY